MLLAPILKHFHLQLSSDDLQSIFDTGTQAVGLIGVIVGRLRASKQATIAPPNPGTPASLIITASLIFGMLMAISGCSDDDYTKAAKAAAGISSGLKAIQSENAVLYQQALIDKQETIAIAQAVGQGTQLNDIFIGEVRTLKQLKTGGDKVALIQAFSELTTGLDHLQGVFHVKNPDAQQRLAAAFAVVEAGEQILSSILAAQPQASPSSSAAPVHTAAGKEDLGNRNRVVANRTQLAGSHYEAGGRAARAEWAYRRSTAGFGGPERRRDTLRC